MEERSPRESIELFKKFIGDNRDRFDALRIIFQSPYGKRRLALAEVEELARAVKAPPYNLTFEALWRAYKKQDNARVRGTSPDRYVANIIPLVSYAIGEADLLEHYKDTINKRYNKWIYEREVAGKRFNEEQRRWLKTIKDHIGLNLSIKKSDLSQGVFKEMGGLGKAQCLFPGRLDEIIEEMNEILSP